MYKTLVRPLIEYGHTIIYPRYEKDKKLIEGVQPRATKIIQELKDKEYTDRLKTQKLPSMEYSKGHMRYDRNVQVHARQIYVKLSIYQ